MAADDGDIAPNATVYVRNLDERVKIPKLIDALREIFSTFGEVVDVVAKKNIKARGQAFIVFESADEAEMAIEELQGFDMFDRPMSLAFAKTKSDITVKREEGDEELERHKKHRLAEKERKQALESANAKPSKRAAPEGALAERPAKANKPAKPAANAGGVVPDEYLPPNKTLFLRDLPEDYTKDALSAVFRRYPGFKDIRLVPGRAGIGFAEYEDENAAITAKEATSGITLGDKAIKVTFQRK